MLKKPFSKLCLCILWLISLSAQGADSPSALCKANPAPDTGLQNIEPNTPTEFTANRATRDEDGISTLEGDVQVIRGGTRINADILRYDESNKKARASGNVRAEDQQMLIESQEIEVHLDTDYIKSTAATYQHKPLHAHGSAATIERTAEDTVRLENATYTTCDETDRAWQLSVDEVELDETAGDATGKNVVVKLKGVPIFYTPWIRFPIDDRRKSGFLMPLAGASNTSGFALETPWYWNIAPNLDATLAPRILAARGLQLKPSFRYINERGSGQLGLEYLDDHKFNDGRYLVSFEHTSRFTPKIGLDLLYNNVSDKKYFEDLGDALGLSSTQYIERRGDLYYRGENWRLLTRAQSFQVVDDSLASVDRPFRRLPQIKLDGAYYNLPGGFDFSSESEWVSFEHDTKTDGDRLHLGIGLERPFASTGYYVRPGIRLSHTQYDLNRKNNLDDEPTRSLPSVDLDAGLLLERDMRKPGYVQTLEPRLYYLHTPSRKQADIPIFDTTDHEFAFEQLFRNSRFSGTDRIGEADRLSLGVTTRWLNTGNGEEKLRASIGRIFHFRNRKVALPGIVPENRKSSEVAAELEIGLNDQWEAAASALWDTRDDHMQRNSVRVQYHAESGFILNMSYRYRHRDLEPIEPITGQHNSLEQSDISMVIPINENWRTVSRWNYDLQENRNLELLAGVEYDTCCWKIRLVGRRYNQNTDKDYNNSIEIQLALKGLAQVGSPIGESLERGIRGYSD